MSRTRQSLGACAATLALTLAASQSWGQATPETARIPQPHLAKARELALQENNWKFPALIACYPDEGQPAQKIIRDPPPTKAFDNLYFVGNGVVAAWVVDTSQGLILIDTMDDQAEVDKYIVGGLQKLGVDPARLKAVIISHGHIDHFGGALYLQNKYGVKVYESALDHALAEKYAAGPNPHSPAPRRDQIVADGQTVALGDVAIKLFVTPGHTPGGFSMLIPVKDHGQARTLAYYGGITSKFLPPDMHAAYETSVTRFAKIAADAKVDGYIANHPSYDDAAGKLEKVRSTPQKPNPFLVGTDGTVRFLNVLRECNLNNAEIEKAQPARARPGAD